MGRGWGAMISIMGRVRRRRSTVNRQSFIIEKVSKNNGTGVYGITVPLS